MQREYVRLLERHDQPCIVIATGPAGCGKTLLATAVGVEKLANGDVDRLILTRPSVSVDNEQLGFLPGNLDEKMRPWMRPILDAMQVHFKPAQIETMIKNKVVELAPLAYMRGRTFNNAWIVLDEAQNTTPQQMLMLLTRIGEGSKIIVTGDLDQHDRGFAHNGLGDFIARMHRPVQMNNDDNDDNWIEHVQFDAEDVLRHPVIPLLLSMYGDGPDG